MFKPKFALLFFCALTSCAQYQEIVILHTNDVHGNIRPLKAFWIDRDSPPLAGGTASLATFVKEWRVKDSEALLLDAGDIFQGTPEGNETRGRLSIELMNLLDYDAAAIGNHEFDFGIPNLKELLTLADFPLMAENLRDTFTNVRPREVDAPMIFDRKGIKIGIGGLVTEDLPKVTTMTAASEWYVTEEIPAAHEVARELRGRGAEIVILVTHIGVDHDSLVAASGPAVDLIVGGHSHTRLESPLVVNGIPIVQAGDKGRAVGEIRLRWDPRRRRVVDMKYRLVDLLHSRYPEDTAIVLFLKPKLESIDRGMNVIVGRALEPIKRAPRDSPHVSSPLGNLQTDLMRKASGADIAFQNKGGIRADVPAGELRLRDLYAVSPFGNTLVTMKMSGALVRAVIEQSLGDGYTPLEISGITVWYDLARAKGDRVVNILINGGRLDPEKTYLIATNSFLGGGGDAYPQFRMAKDFHETGRNLLDIEREFYESNRQGVRGVQEQRWRSVEAF